MREMASASILNALSALRVFEVAARTGSFSAAAAALHVTPAAVSQQIRNLEDVLGMRLFERLPRGIRLTPNAAEYADSVRSAFERIAAASARLQASLRPATLTIATTPSFAVKWLIPRLGDFQQAHPDLDVRLSTSNVVIDLNTSDIDIAIRFGRGRWAGLHCERLMGATLFPVCSPALLRRGKGLKTPADLRLYPMLHLMADEWPAWFEAVGLSMPRNPRGPHFSDISVVLQAAIEGQGVALGQSVIVADDIKAGRLLAPLDVRIPSGSSYYLVGTPDAFKSEKASRFVSWLHAQCIESEPAGPRRKKLARKP